MDSVLDSVAALGMTLALTASVYYHAILAGWVRPDIPIRQYPAIRRHRLEMLVLACAIIPIVRFGAPLGAAVLTTALERGDVGMALISGGALLGMVTLLFVRARDAADPAVWLGKEE